MPLVKLERLIGFPPCHVWAVLSDFGAFQDWAMGGAGTSKVEGDGPGMVRLLDVPGLGEIAECLDKARQRKHARSPILFCTATRSACPVTPPMCSLRTEADQQVQNLLARRIHAHAGSMIRSRWANRSKRPM